MDPVLIGEMLSGLMFLGIIGFLGTRIKRTEREDPLGRKESH